MAAATARPEPRDRSCPLPGVAMEPHVMSGGGLASFHGKNLDFTSGLWPGKLACKTLHDETITVTPASCVVNGVSMSIGLADCTLVSGAYTAAVTKTQEATGCVNKNGKCCKEWYPVAKAVRTSLLVILKTPYGIALFICLFLDLILPYDKDETDEEDGVTTKEGTVDVAQA